MEGSMGNNTENLVKALFETKAIRVCPSGSPFWYTSGKIGPYYINTHFLYGSEEKANALLKIIDAATGDKEQCSGIVAAQVLENYRQDRIFKSCMDTLLEAIQNTIPVQSVDYISGGERRDWFFSLVASELLNKPHITIFKDLDAMVFHKGKSEKIGSLQGTTVLHIADLITSASSYERAWIPVIQKASGVFKASFVIIDRMQGGHELLESLGVASHALVRIDRGVFREACDKQYINSTQYEMVVDYMDDPDGFMKAFFLEHPEFMENALKSDEKTAKRARLCIESGFYPTK
jgi:orotate phosphoribosyltransferase